MPNDQNTIVDPQEAKRDLATEQCDVYPEGVPREECIRHRSQYAWRILDGKAVYVCYHIYDLPASRELPLPAGLRNSRSEFGIEVLLILAFLHFWIGVSLDNACQIIEFFTGLSLPKSQADSLLNQLSADWQEQYDTIAELIALQMIVYIDETGWKVGKTSCYTWVFSTAMHVLFRCGVSRRKEEATAVLGDLFAGIGVTDDYAAYKNLFSQHQLCWAHLIRKAIKLALQNPNETEYAEFLDQLCAIYDEAKQLRDAQQANTSAELQVEDVVEQLQSRIESLCHRHQEPIIKSEKSGQPLTPAHAETFILLQRELVGNLDCLFVFVEHPEVEPTNNRSERNARREAEIRKGARTSKSQAGAKRRSVIVTVFASLQTRIENFTLSKLLEEIDRWLTAGSSIFAQELQNNQSNIPPPQPAT
jgi:transposase